MLLFIPVSKCHLFIDNEIDFNIIFHILFKCFRIIHNNLCTAIKIKNAASTILHEVKTLTKLNDLAKYKFQQIQDFIFFFPSLSLKQLSNHVHN